MKTIFKRFGKVVLLATLASLLALTPVFAAGGDLDPSFGNGGKVITDVMPNMRDNAYSIAIQEDGKIVAAGTSYNLNKKVGDVAVARYNSNGALDTTFNSTGIVITNLGGADQGRDVAIQEDGKIVVSGRRCNAEYTICSLAVIRYNEDGSRDTNFGPKHNGISIIKYNKSGNNGTFGGIGITADGEILVAGYVMDAMSGGYDFAIYRLLSGGKLDATFSGNGVQIINFGILRTEVAQDLAIQPDGRIVVAGYTCDNNRAHCDFALTRLRPNGPLDKTFGADGKQVTDLGGNEQAPAIALQADGKIVLAGRKTVGTTINMALARYTPTGSLDKTFNRTGKKVINFLKGYEEANYDVLVQPDGKIVTMGYVTNQGNNFAVVRLLPGGAFDTSFGVGGKQQIDFGYNDYAYAIALDSNGNYVTAGHVDDGTSEYFALARLLP